MFKLDPNPTFPAIVQITVPGRESRPLPVVFRHKKKSELTEFLKDTAQSDIDMALDIVESVTEKDEGLTLRDFFEQLFENYPAAALDLYFTYRRELSESRAKN